MNDALLSALSQNHRPIPRSRFWFHIVDDKPPPSIADIKAAVIDYYKVERSDLTSVRRGTAGRARMVAMYLAYKLTDHSHTVIGRSFRRCDHTVSLNAFKKISAAIPTDIRIALDVAALEARFA